MNQYTNRWSTNETILLQKIYPTKSMQELLSLIPSRSRRAILCKAYVLGLRKSNSFHKKVKPTSVKRLSIMDKGYIAGFIDGEGTISIHKQHANTKIVHYQPIVQISNTNRAILKYLQEITGAGHIYNSQTHRAEHKKEQFVLIIVRILDIKALLEQIESILRIKKLQAKIVLEFIDDYMANRKNVRIDLYEKIKQSNKRGRF